MPLRSQRLTDGGKSSASSCRCLDVLAVLVCDDAATFTWDRKTSFTSSVLDDAVDIDRQLDQLTAGQKVAGAAEECSWTPASRIAIPQDFDSLLLVFYNVSKRHKRYQFATFQNFIEEIFFRTKHANFGRQLS